MSTPFQVLNLVEQMGLGEEEKMGSEGSRGERERSAEQSHDNEEASTSSLPKNFTQEQVGNQSEFKQPLSILIEGLFDLHIRICRWRQ